MNVPPSIRLPADVQDALQSVSQRTGASPSDIVERALRAYLRDVRGNCPSEEALSERARRQSLRARRATREREALRREQDAWEENADTSGWKT